MTTIFIAGPCVIENAGLLDVVATELVRLNQKYGIDIIFKASFDKANRTSLRSFRGPGLDKGLQMLADIKERYSLRILTDIHECRGRLPPLPRWLMCFRYRPSSAVRPTCWWPQLEPAGW